MICQCPKCELREYDVKTKTCLNCGFTEGDISSAWYVCIVVIASILYVGVFLPRFDFYNDTDRQSCRKSCDAAFWTKDSCYQHCEGLK